MVELIDTRPIRAGLGIIRFPDAVVLEVSGSDAADYLHRRLTGNIRALAAGRALYSLLLPGDGRLIADMEVISRPDGKGFVLVSQPPGGSVLLEQLERYIFTEDCKVADVSASAAVALVVGERIGELGISWDASGRVQPCLSQPVDGGEVLVAGTARYHLPAAFLVGLCGADPSADYPLPNDSRIMTAEELDAIRVEQGVPVMGRDMTDRTIPLEAGLEWAIDYEKGCFPGQEVVARIRNLGHPAKVLMGLSIGAEAAPPAGSAIQLRGEEIGRTHTATMSQRTGGPVALATVSWKHQDTVEALAVVGEGGYSGVANIIPVPIPEAPLCGGAGPQ